MKRYRVKSGAKFSLKQYDPDDTGEYKKSDQGKEKAKAETATAHRRARWTPRASVCQRDSIASYRPAGDGYERKGWDHQERDVRHQPAGLQSGGL